VVLSGTGYSLRFGGTTSNGLLDVTLRAATTGWTQTDLWQFDGERYILRAREQKTQ
jgi:hypothetical protein